MKPSRHLTLRREALSALAADDLASVAGGTHIYTDCGCVTHNYSCDACPIPSLPLNSCACPSAAIYFSCLICNE